MTECDLETAVAEWLIDHPETLKVFESLGIDYCCGGRSLEHACQQKGLEPGMVLDRLYQAIETERQKKKKG